jgi:hypothetical protein
MITLVTKFDERRQSEPWKNEIAKELNILLGRAEYFQETSNDDSDKAAESATISIVRRVAEFEEIETVEQMKGLV